MRAPVPAAIVAMTIVTGGGCGSTAAQSPSAAGTTVATAPAPEVGSMTVADVLLQKAARVRAARAAGSPDLAALSDGLVRVRADGALEVVLHARSPVGAVELADLRDRQVDVVDVSSTPAVSGQSSAGLVQAWVPVDRIDAVGRLEWVAAVTPPAYPPAGG
jgi:hypothetical protein